MHSIADIVGRFKQNWTKELSVDAITQACREAGMVWHNSMLNPIVTIQVFFLQILHGNTACEHLSHLTGMSFTAAAYCKARISMVPVSRCLIRHSFRPISANRGSRNADVDFPRRTGWPCCTRARA